MQQRRRLGAFGAAVAALALLAVVIPAGQAARTGGAPSLTAVAQPDGTVHATWTLPAGTIGEELIYDQTGAQADTGTLAAGAYGCGSVDTWCWPARGVPLKCYFLHSHGDGAPCPGDIDIGNTQTTLDTDPLTVGQTYYFQILSMDACVGETSPCPAPWQYWSNLVAVKIVKTASAPSTGSGGSSEARSEVQMRVSFSHTVTVTGPGGKKVITKSTVLVPGDLVRSYGDPTRITITDGNVVMDHNSTLAYERVDAKVIPVWQVRSGQIYWQNNDTGVDEWTHLGLEGAASEVSICCGVSVVLAVHGQRDVISAIDAPQTGGTISSMHAFGGGDKPSAYCVNLPAGMQVTARNGTFSKPKRFVPTRAFWK